MSERRLILASASQTRADMLRAAGLEITIDPARIDEAEIKLACKAEGLTAEEVAEALADTKARRVAPRHGQQDFVLGCDQMLEIEGEWLDKPDSLETARAQLHRLSGKTHRLVSAAVIHSGTTRLWHRIDHARLTVRPLSDGFLDTYLAAEGEAALASVGAYRLEGRGAQLFSRIEGDFFTILGLPLLPLLDYLRLHGLVRQ